MTAPARIKEADLARIFKAAKKADFPRCRVFIDGAGNLTVDVSNEASLPIDRVNPLDRVFKK